MVRKDGDAIHYCPNESACPQQLIGKIDHFIGRRAMNIDSLGTETVAGLFKKGLIKTFADLYDLKAEQLLNLEVQARQLVLFLLLALQLPTTQLLTNV